MQTRKSFSRHLHVTITPNLRIVAFCFLLALFIIGMIIGSLTPLSANEAQTITNSIQDIWNQGSLLLRYERVALNDIPLCLTMFVPAFGQVFIVYCGYETGVAIAAQAITQSIPSSMRMQNVLFTPTTWLDGVVFGLAASEGFILLLSILNRSFKAESRRFLLTILGSVTLLLVSEVILLLTGGVLTSPMPIIP